MYIITFKFDLTGKFFSKVIIKVYVRPVSQKLNLWKFNQSIYLVT